jgi:hypothetical protein
VVYYAQDTEVLTTFFVTTTIPAGNAPYTSIFTDKKSAAVTEVIGVNSKLSAPSISSTDFSVSSRPGSTSSPNTPPNSPASTKSSSGLSSGAKIGIGVTIPLVFIILSVVGILFCLRRRKVGQLAGIGQPETHDGGLPEHMSTLSIFKESKEHPPSYKGSHVEADSSPIAEMHQDQPSTAMISSPNPASHELNADQQRHESGGTPAFPSHELSSHQQHYEASGNPKYASHELPTQAQASSQASASPEQTRNAAPIPPAEAISSSSFPAPWDTSGAAGFEKDLSIGPAEAAVAEDQELKELEQEVARVQMQKQRLQQMQALEAREEELRRSIAERKKLAKKP